MKQLSIGTYSRKDHKLKAKEMPKREARVRPKRELPVYQGQGKKRSKLFKLLVLFVFVLIVGLVGFGYLRLQEVNSRVERFDEEGNKVECTNILNPDCWTDAFKPQLKQTNGYTNALVLGLDTRKSSNSLNNTDSIIFVSFNHKTQKTMMISIPRDFYADPYQTKINAVYAFTKDKKPDDPFFYIKEYITQLTGQPIHYMGTIRFEGVTEGIDQIGGVEICIPDAFTAQYPNPKATPSSREQWTYYKFEAGCQTLDGEHALVYARFRYVPKGPSSLASDFSRARRQQEIIEAVKTKILAEDLSIGERAEKYWALLTTFNENVSVYGVTFEDVLAGLAFIDTADRDPINIVLDPNFGGLNKLIYADNGSATGYIIRARDKTYQAIRDEIELIWKHPEFYKDQPTILVRNMSGAKSLPADNAAIKLKDDIRFYTWFNVQDEALSDKFSGIQLVDFTGGEKSASFKWLQDYFGDKATVVSKPEEIGISRTNRKEDFAILVGGEATPTPSPTMEITETGGQ